MAIAGFDGKNITKKVTAKNPNGQNMVAKSSYNSRSIVLDQNDNTKKYPHAPKSDLECESEIILPPGTPERYKNPSTLWSEIQGMKYENIGKAMILNLPHEATEEQRHEMVELFVRRNLTSQFLVCQVDYHKPKMIPSENDPTILVSNNNYHAHILTTELQMIGGEWSEKKSTKPYVDEHGVPLQKTNKTPKLKNKKLQYDENGSIIFKEGWQELKYNNDGSPKLHADGTPVLVDIRTPETDKQGNQIYKMDKGKPRPVWKRKEIHAASVTKFGWIRDFRESWGECQNEILRKYNIRNKEGELVQVDMRSYARQDAEINDGMERIPQIKVFDPYIELTEDEKNYSQKAKQDIIKENKKRKARNEAINEIRKLRKEKNKLDDSIKVQEEIEQKEKEVLSQIDPKAEWTQTWVTQAEDLYKFTSSYYRYTNVQLIKTINKARQFIESMPKNLTRKNRIEKSRIIKHHNLMIKLGKNVRLENLTTTETIKKLAEEAWDNLSDQQKVSFVRDRYGFETSKIYARVLAREKDNLDIVDGLEQPAPEIPDEKTNENIIRAESEHICETRDFMRYQDAAYAKWDTASYQAPPEEVLNVLDVCASVDGYYTAKLTKEPWKAVSSVGGFNYNVEEIEKEAKLETKKIEKEEAAQKQKKITAAPSKEITEPKPKLIAKKLSVISIDEQAIAKAKAAVNNKQSTPQQPVQQTNTITQKAIPPTKAEPLKRPASQHVARQSEIQKQTDEYRKQKVRNNYEQLIPQFQLAVKQKDQDTVNKISTLVRSAFTEEEIEMKYKGSKSWRNTEMNSMINKLIDIKSYGGINEDAKRELEKQIFNKRGKPGKPGKPILRTINKMIAEHNQTASEYNQIDIKEYRKYSDEANFWYGVQNPDKAIRSNKAETPANSKGTPELQIETPKSRPRRSRQEPASNRSSNNQTWEVLPDGTARPLNIGPNTLKKHDDHEKSQMEKAEDELYQGWDPGKHGQGL